ncbi:MAG: methyltransferase [Rubripirellula sp.]
MNEPTDAGRFYALLRFEEASLALRAVLKINLVDRIADQHISRKAIGEMFGFTKQATRTFLALLEVMEILKSTEGRYCVTDLAKMCLADGRATSRKPYLAMGMDSQVDELIDVLQGKNAADAIPLYGGENAGATVMDEPEVAREIALGLSSRARNFADSLATAISSEGSKATTLADIGAGSPYVAQACLAEMPGLENAILLDRPNGMRFAHEIVQEEKMDTRRLVFQEADFFDAVPTADIYVLSNTAHDWQPQEYARIMNHIRRAIPADGLVCIHEPLLLTNWDTDTAWLRALWMACYALTLLRLTLGQGTCYSIEEHHEILGNSGFHPIGVPIPTCDGCTALLYRPMTAEIN